MKGLTVADTHRLLANVLNLLLDISENPARLSDEGDNIHGLIETEIETLRWDLDRRLRIPNKDVEEEGVLVGSLGQLDRLDYSLMQCDKCLRILDPSEALECTDPEDGIPMDVCWLCADGKTPAYFELDTVTLEKIIRDIDSTADRADRKLKRIEAACSEAVEDEEQDCLMSAYQVGDDIHDLGLSIRRLRSKLAGVLAMCEESAEQNPPMGNTRNPMRAYWTD